MTIAHVYRITFKQRNCTVTYGELKWLPKCTKMHRFFNIKFLNFSQSPFPDLTDSHSEMLHILHYNYCAVGLASSSRQALHLKFKVVSFLHAHFLNKLGTRENDERTKRMRGGEGAKGRVSLTCGLGIVAYTPPPGGIDGRHSTSSLLLVCLYSTCHDLSGDIYSFAQQHGVQQTDIF